MKIATLWLLEGIMDTKKYNYYCKSVRYYPYLTTGITFQNRCEKPMCCTCRTKKKTSILAPVPQKMKTAIHRYTLWLLEGVLGAESIIVSVLHAEVHAESISMRWEYHISVILSACSAESMILSAPTIHPPKVKAYVEVFIFWGTRRKNIQLFLFVQQVQHLGISHLFWKVSPVAKYG